MATNPYVGTECLHVGWLDAGGNPSSYLALVELDVGMLLQMGCHKVIDGAGPVGSDR